MTGTTFVGRTTELNRLVVVFEDAIKARRARLATVIGSPGVGKTRLARELAGLASSRARIVELRCDPAGGATFAPIAEALRIAASLDDDAGDDTIVAPSPPCSTRAPPIGNASREVAAAVLGRRRARANPRRPSGRSAGWSRTPPGGARSS